MKYLFIIYVLLVACDNPYDTFERYTPEISKNTNTVFLADSIAIYGLVLETSINHNYNIDLERIEFITKQSWITYFFESNKLIARPKKGDIGRHTIKFRMISYDRIETRKFDLIVTNSAPEITSTSIESVKKDESYVYQVLAEDINNTNLNFGLIQAPVGFSINSNGLLTGETTNLDLGDHPIKLFVTDELDSAYQDFHLTIHNSELISTSINYYESSKTEFINNEYILYSVKNNRAFVQRFNSDFTLINSFESSDAINNLKNSLYANNNIYFFNETEIDTTRTLELIRFDLNSNTFQKWSLISYSTSFYTGVLSVNPANQITINILRQLIIDEVFDETEVKHYVYNSDLTLHSSSENIQSSYQYRNYHLNNYSIYLESDMFMTTINLYRHNGQFLRNIFVPLSLSETPKAYDVNLSIMSIMEPKWLILFNESENIYTLDESENHSSQDRFFRILKIDNGFVIIGYRTNGNIFSQFLSEDYIIGERKFYSIPNGYEIKDAFILENPAISVSNGNNTRLYLLSEDGYYYD